MPGRAKPKLVESDAKSKRKYDLVEQGVELYAEEAKKPAHLRMGTRKIMEKVTAAHKQQTGETITFSHTTIYRRYHGGRSLYEFNKAKSWINHDERECIIDFLIQTAERGFPHTHRRLEESANSIIRNRLPAFPGVGVNWTARFLVLNSDRLSCYWGSPLDQCRARAVNPHTINAWFTLVGGLIEEHGVEWENIWGADETGVELGEAGKERVIGPSGKNNQKRTSSGNRQNVTVMATIGACGQSLPPFVIYKGQAFQVKWFQNNPSNATLSYSVKGYMTGEVSLDWIKHFDRHTSVQAQHGAKARLLLVDGHVSHYTLELLNYARDHNIILACYPSHTTHVLQGLDVACFGRLKQLYSRYAHELEDRTGYPITKENFLIPFSRAYTETFTPETIASAFSKTGIHPFNPNIVPASAMAPSLPTSTQSSLPLTLPTAVARLAEMWNIDPQLLDDAPEGVPVDTDIEGMGAEIPGNSGDNVQHEASATQGNSAHHLTGNLREALANTSAEFLVNNAPITSEDQLEPVPFHYLPPLPAFENELAALGRPTTELEKSLMAQLKAYKRRDESREAAYRGAQAHLVLAERHCSRLQSQLGAKEGRARARANGAGNERLMGDGMPRALSQGEFFEQVERLAVARAAQEAAHQQKEAEKARLKAVKTEWEAAEAARKAQNQEAHRLWKEGPLKDWLEAQEQAKAGGFRFNTPRPKAPFKLKPIPKPWLVQNTPNSAQEQPRDEDDGGSHDDGNDSEAV